MSERGPKCDTLFEKWRPAAVAHIEERGPFTTETLLLWAFREGFKARGDRDRAAKSMPQRGSDFCRSCGASIPHRHGEGRCPDCMEHLPKSMPQKGSQSSGDCERG